jgi:hypothetical protein
MTQIPARPMKRRHHTVPRFHLERFADDGRRLMRCGVPYPKARGACPGCGEESAPEAAARPAEVTVPGEWASAYDVARCDCGHGYIRNGRQGCPRCERGVVPFLAPGSSPSFRDNRIGTLRAVISSGAPVQVGPSQLRQQ